MRWTTGVVALFAAVVSVGVAASAPCDAAPGDAHGAASAGVAVGMSLPRAVALGAERGPAVREAAAPLRAEGALRDASRAPLTYAPRLTATGGRRWGDFGAGPEITGSVLQEVPLHGVGSRRGELADAIARAARSDVERARLEGAAMAGLAWIDLAEAQALLQLRLAARRDAEEIARVARARTDRGVAMPSESTLAASEVGAAELGEEDAEGRVFEARAALQFAVGLAPDVEVVAEGEPVVNDEAPPVRPGGAAHPAELAAQGQIELARADAKLARATAYPTLGVGVTYTREGTGQQIVTGTIVLPIPIVDPSPFDAARYEGHVAVSESRAERVRAELARDRAMSEHERLHTREVHATLATRVVVPLRETLRLARASYQAGTQDVTGFLLLRQRLVSAEEQLGKSTADVLRADLRYDLAHGTLLARAGSR